MIELYPHQQDAINKLTSGKILWGDVGTGKSLTAAAYYMQHQAPRDVYVITTARKRDSLDWEQEFAHFGVGTRREATLAGVLRVDSWNNIAKYKNVRGAFFIFDEQRLVGSGAWAKAFEFISKNNTWILLTATPGDSWLDYVSVFIANGFYKNRTEFKLNHVVYNTYSKFPKVDHYINTGALKRHRKDLLVHMPYKRHTTRQSVDIEVEYDRELVDKVLKKRWNPYLERPIKSIPELFSVMRRVVNSDPTRLTEVRKLLEQHDRIIIFYSFDYELEALRTLSDTVTVAEWNGHNHQDVPFTKRWVYLVQYAAGAEAWNCITTDAMVFYSQQYSYKIRHQAHGRIDRINTKFTILKYYDLISKSSIDLAIRKCVLEKKDFNEAKFVAGFR